MLKITTLGLPGRETLSISFAVDVLCGLTLFDSYPGDIIKYLNYQHNTRKKQKKTS